MKKLQLLNAHTSRVKLLSERLLTFRLPRTITVTRFVINSLLFGYSDLVYFHCDNDLCNTTNKDFSYPAVSTKIIWSQKLNFHSNNGTDFCSNRVCVINYSNATSGHE